ncbi:SAM-dependent methyltransferase [Acidomonas methanolica]|uniref:Cyclopropane-fatty-acyl-phospholipid synthase n=1 Tax=Acidomonas methanolica NBRC 104435 TaxID=1231351 RepID=A0A023D512_ACIMT|nr:cyclopropane-fatty-acyl-phospholipid synthase family protein [Acidomonas methanolica]MBU2653731.1 cyclopropane-fatty-acyl-phospholipid synthase family protein [Acidomonas methanolica]TCS31683.1 cyclopropane-fatty-acyl-phospholipid synthase [Acidomonas methanolica]GAJ28896.1 cyclopropane-fatty-acyl-phospholipid synthase [Acidomonas methanolica NBRC 104435]GBQ56400.1 cyclopropane-fatty-acyl-phospholipid synthase [Acidomonas methanolica]GEK98100.1 cyclopropane-fatty-acyl-phospholipid synthase 
MSFVFDRIMRHFIAEGTLRVVFPDGTEKIYAGRRPGPAAGMRITTERAQKALLFNSGLAFGEGYMNGEILPVDCVLEDLLTVLMVNLKGSNHFFNRLEEYGRFFLRRVQQFNPRWRARRNVAHHYDLNGELYRLFLDEDRQYSCAYFAREDMTLEEAQVAKKHHIASKLLLDRPGLTVLDIGCGWGGMALTLARDYGAEVTGITLSQEQLLEARRRAEAAGLTDRVRFALCDYRAVRSSFDRIVSVGMFEHVGLDHYQKFFQVIHDRLKPDGVALVHSIGREDGPGSTNPWLKKYIFPGGYSPAVSETLAAVERSGLWLTDCEILRLHYAKTIAIWRERFAAHREQIVALYDERFYRMFTFYLTGAELSFRVQGHMNFQLQLTRSIDATPLTRDYMVDSDRKWIRSTGTSETVSG